MISRRTFVRATSLASCFGAVPNSVVRALCASERDLADNAELQLGTEDLTAYVNLSIGTGGHGHTYPGATVPFGAVQLSPDTYTKGWDWCSGYYHTDTSIMGFSHTHLSGTGCGDLLDLLLMPNAGEVKWEPGTRENPDEGYRARFSHADEQMEPGYYSVSLNDRKVHVELTATERTGLHRYTFPANEASHFVLDFAHSYDDPASPVSAATLEIVGQDTITGGRTVESWASGRRFYFAAQFSKPFMKTQLQQNGVLLSEGSTTAAGKDLKAVVHYNTTESEQILVRVGISGVSVANALKNLHAEMPDWDFDAIRAKAKSAWQSELGRIQIETNDTTQRTIFYTSLYHMMVAPTLFD